MSVLVEAPPTPCMSVLVWHMQAERWMRMSNAMKICNDESLASTDDDDDADDAWPRNNDVFSGDEASKVLEPRRTNGHRNTYSACLGSAHLGLYSSESLELGTRGGEHRCVLVSAGLGLPGAASLYLTPACTPMQFEARQNDRAEPTPSPKM